MQTTGFCGLLGEAVTSSRAGRTAQALGRAVTGSPGAPPPCLPSPGGPAPGGEARSSAGREVVAPDTQPRVADVGSGRLGAASPRASLDGAVRPPPSPPAASTESHGPDPRSSLNFQDVAASLWSRGSRCDRGPGRGVLARRLRRDVTVSAAFPGPFCASASESSRNLRAPAWRRARALDGHPQVRAGARSLLTSSRRQPESPSTAGTRSHAASPRP